MLNNKVKLGDPCVDRKDNVEFKGNWTKRIVTLKNMEPVQSAIEMLQGAYMRTRAALGTVSFSEVYRLTECPTCKREGPALILCPVCQRRRPELGPVSCTKCQISKPRVFMCLKYHGKQPLLRVCPCSECQHKSKVKAIRDYHDCKGQSRHSHRHKHRKCARDECGPYHRKQHRCSKGRNENHGC